MPEGKSSTGGDDSRQQTTPIAFYNGNQRIDVTISPIDPNQSSRATCVVDATSSGVIYDSESSMPIQLQNEKLVVQGCWPNIGRDIEANIITEARRVLLKSENPDDWKWLKCLPVLYASTVLESSNTKNILDELQLPARGRSSPRILRLMLFRRLQPLDDIHDPAVFLNAWIHCFMCHYALWKKGIEHRDISVWNLMWDSTNQRGILNDFDLAVLRFGKSAKNRGGERTGTLPFMAKDLLMGNIQERLYLHELESFVWVLTWLCIDKSPSMHISIDWRTGTQGDILSIRNNFIYEFEKINAVPKFAAVWRKCKLFLHLLQMFDSSKTAKAGGKKTLDENFADNIYSEVLKIAIAPKSSTYGFDHVSDFYEELISRCRKIVSLPEEEGDMDEMEFVLLQVPE